MENSDPIRCRIAACQETRDDGKEWSFYLINDSDTPLDLVVLYQISYESGNMANRVAADVRITGLAPGAHALVWCDDSNGAELRMEFSLRVQVRRQDVRLQFEFPKLYKLRDLPVVNGLGKRGWEVAAEGLGGVGVRPHHG